MDSPPCPYPAELDEYLQDRDVSGQTIKAFRSDWAKFRRWFETANHEPLDLARITVRDVADFREHLTTVRRQKVTTVNRALVSIRRFLDHLVRTGQLPANPAEAVKELRRVRTAPKALKRSAVRRILREIEIRQDHRAGAIIGLMVFAGLRVSDVAGLTLADLSLHARSGQVICRQGKGGKQRTVPLSREARRWLNEYLAARPPAATDRLFIGERGALSEDGLRAICIKYAAISGVAYTPHVLRHTFARRYLESTHNDLPGLAQILGHENLNTTAIYTQQDDAALQEHVEDLTFE